MKFIFRIVLIIYLSAIAYYAFKPFEPIPARKYPEIGTSTNGVIKAGFALEDSAGGDQLRKVLVKSGRMSVEILLKTDSLHQGGPARIVSFATRPLSRNFTLGQEGNGISFRLRTSETDENAIYPSLVVPKVFDETAYQHLVVTYDGVAVRLFVDGMQHPVSESLGGDFSTWGRDHLLILGDDAYGGRPWFGHVKYFSIYDRALDAADVRKAYDGHPPAGKVYSFPDPDHMYPLHYRNLFIFSDPMFSAKDFSQNVMAFVPLALLMLPAWPVVFRQRRMGVPVALLAGLALSGFIEVVQRGIMGRVPCTADLAYNMLGTLIGCGILQLVLKSQRNSGKIPNS